MPTKRKAGPVARRERRVFSAEFKAEAVRLMAERRALGVSLVQVGRLRKKSGGGFNRPVQRLRQV